jgi:hypothetical protein
VFENWPPIRPDLEKLKIRRVVFLVRILAQAPAFDGLTENEIGQKRIVFFVHVHEISNSPGVAPLVTSCKPLLNGTGVGIKFVPAAGTVIGVPPRIVGPVKT